MLRGAVSFLHKQKYCECALAAGCALVCSRVKNGTAFSSPKFPLCVEISVVV